MSLTNGPSDTPDRSVASVAELSAIETSMLADGDLAYVVLTDTFYTLSKSSTASLSSTVVATKNSNGGVRAGRWTVFPVVEASSFFAVVADVEALEDLDDSDFDDGAMVWMQSVRSYWFRRVEADPGTTDDITIVRADSGLATWYRDQEPHRSWRDEDTWYVDGVSGDDENSGLTSGAPLATADELSRRTCATEPRAGFTVHVLAGGMTGVWKVNLVADDTLFVSGVGATTVAQSATITAMVNQNRATNTKQRVTAAITWSADYLYDILQSGAQGYVVSNPLAGSAETKFWTDTGTTFVDPTNGQTVRRLVVPAFAVEMTGFVSNIILTNLSMTATLQLPSALIIVRNVITTSAGQCYTYGCSNLVAAVAAFHGVLSVDSNFDLSAALLAWDFAPIPLLIARGKTGIIGHDSTIYGITEVTVEGHLSASTDFECRDGAGTGCIQLAAMGASAYIASRIYGSGNVTVLKFVGTVNRVVTYTDKNLLTATSSDANWDTEVTTGAWAGLPSVSAANYSGILVGS